MTAKLPALAAQWEELLRSSPLGIALLDTELRYVDVNPRLAAINGLPRQAHLGRSYADLFGTMPGSEQVLGQLRQVLATGEPIEGQTVTIVREDLAMAALSYRVSIYPLREEGVIQGLYAFVDDITAHKQAEAERDELLQRERAARERAEAAAEALAESEARYRAILAALAEGIVVQGRDGTILAANVSAERILGLNQEQLTGRTSTDLGWQAIREDGSPFPAHEHPARVALRTGEPMSNIPMGMRRPDGSLVWLSINAQPLRRSSSEPPHMVVASFVDITETRRAELERARLLREAQEAVRVRDEFLSVAAHELRTPLTSLRLHLDTLLRQISRADPGLASQLASRFRVLERQIGRLSSLILTLLDASRLATGRLNLEPREMDLALMVRQLAEAFGEEFRQVGTALTVRVPEAPLVGVWDSLRMEQVVVNLLSNAVRYGDGKPVEVTLERQEHRAILEVRDQGLGISPQDIARIFGKFERAVPERHYGGLGLGLYITQQIINAMGGTIEVESAPGRGSTFTLYLPLNSGAEAG